MNEDTKLGPEEDRASEDPMRNPEVIDLGKITRYLQKQGYEKVDLNQPWRNVTGEVVKDGQRYFFKLGTNQQISAAVENECFWNRLAVKHFISSGHEMAQVNESGRLEKLFWFTCDFIEGALAALQDSRAERLEPHIPRIAQLAVDILGLPDIKMPRDQGDKNEGGDVGEKLLKKAKQFSREARHDCRQLLGVVARGKGLLKSRLQHGDFTPWHIIITSSDRLALIDGEHARHFPLYYDAAYFYHRVYTTNRRPDLAIEFLKEYQQRLPRELKTQFTKNFLPVLAERLIGGYFDAERDKKVSWKLQNLLEGDVIKQ